MDLLTLAAARRHAAERPTPTNQPLVLAGVIDETFPCPKLVVRVCPGLGISDFHFHDLRHTAASWLRMQGADIHTVAQLLGHKDLRMAARYQHLSPAFLAEAVNRLDTTFAECHP
ncbi:MAG: tyrosine-type recombinase/integrase [Terriglobales bacterium]